MKMEEKIPLAIDAKNLTKVFRRGNEEILAVNDVSLEIKKSEFVSFVGPSGSGKTTLVNLLGCLDNPSSGNLSVAGRLIFGGERPLSEKELTRLRRELFGYIFQKFYLIPTLNVRENVLLPCTFYRKNGTEDKASKLLEMLGIDKRTHHLPGQLSGGEMQRVAIARALINDPEILLADEPTGNLDTARSNEISRILKELNEKMGITIVLVTHNLNLAQTSHRVINMRDGRLS
jgi:putative ABC transport system ATP-binding protein